MLKTQELQRRCVLQASLLSEFRRYRDIKFQRNIFKGQHTLVEKTGSDEIRLVPFNKNHDEESYKKLAESILFIDKRISSVRFSDATLTLHFQGDVPREPLILEISKKIQRIVTRWYKSKK